MLQMKPLFVVGHIHEGLLLLWKVVNLLYTFLGEKNPPKPTNLVGLVIPESCRPLYQVTHPCLLVAVVGKGKNIFLSTA